MSALTFYYFTSTFYSHWLVVFLLDLYGLYGSGGFHRDRLIPWSRSNRWRGVINIPRTPLCLCNSNPVPRKRHLADFVETSTMANHSDNPVKPGELCMSKCLYNGHHKAKDMVRCCQCAAWFHIDCINKIEEYFPGVWPCFQCREMPSQLTTMTTMLTELVESVNTLTQNVNQLHRDNLNIRTELKDKDTLNTRLQQENSELKTRIGTLSSDTSAAHWSTLPQPTGSTVIGSSLIWDIDENKLLNSKCVCLPGTCINDIKAAISKFPTSQKLHRLDIVVGGNDCDRRTDANLDVAQILHEYENLIKAAKEVSVAISSVCPRNRGDEVTQCITTLNAGLKVHREELGVDFIDNDPSFHLQDGSRNDGFLLADGIQLTRAPRHKLVSNLQLVLRRGETSAHTDRRYRDLVTTSHADSDDDDSRHPFWQQSRRKAVRHSHGQNRPVYDHASGPRQGAAAPRPQQNRQSASPAYLPPHAHARRPHGRGPRNSQRLGAPDDAPQRHNATYRPPTPLAPMNAEARSSRPVADQRRFPLVPRSPSPPNRNISGLHRRHILLAPPRTFPLSVNYVSEKTTQQLHARVETVYAINVIREGTSPEHVSYRTRGLAASPLQRESFQWIF